jgi:hypothetical protein
MRRMTEILCRRRKENPIILPSHPSINAPLKHLELVSIDTIERTKKPTRNS